jgi:hypothetical protein
MIEDSGYPSAETIKVVAARSCSEVHMELLLAVLKEYGPWGPILILLLYMLLKGRVTFEYPRPARENKERS